MSEKKEKKIRRIARYQYNSYYYAWIKNKPSLWRIFRYLKWKKEKPNYQRIENMIRSAAYKRG